MTTNSPSANPEVAIVINEVAAKALPDGTQPTPEFIEGLTGVFAELEAEYLRLRHVLGLPNIPYASADALRTAFNIYIDDADYEPQLEPGQQLPPGIIKRNWDSYFQPFPHKNTLKNIPGITDSTALANYEYAMAAMRSVELLLGSQFDERRATSELLSEFHHYLFKDTYDWAGKHRIVNMVKGNGPGFADPHTGEIYWFLSAARHMAEIVPWHELDHRAFAQAVAAVFAYVNYAHPFREGNGRASRMFMRHIARYSPYRLQFSRTSPDDWNQASANSTPNLAQPMPNPEPLIPIFDGITIRAGSQVDPKKQVFDSQSIWPELTVELDEDQRYILDEALTDIWLEGWIPEFNLAANLTAFLIGTMSAEAYQAKAREGIPTP